MNGRITLLFPIADLTVGGTQQQLLDLVRGLDKERFRPVVLTLIAGGALEPEFRRTPGCRLLSLRRTGKLDFSAVWKTGRILRKLHVDVVQPFLTPATLFSLLPALVCRTPVKIVTERSGPPPTGMSAGYLIYLKVEDLLTRFADWAVPNSAAGRAYLLRRGIPQSKIKVIYNGINLARLAAPEANVRAVRESLGVASEGKLVGMLARLYPVKGHATFLRSAVLVSQAMPETKFAVVGGGPLRSELEGLASQLGIASKVVFFGEQRDVGAYLAAFDVTVLSSDAEGCSNVILEAMAVGRPVICTDVGGNRELVRQGETGLLAPPGNPQELAQAIMSLLRDTRAAETMGTNAKRMVAGRFSLQGMVARYQELYQHTLERKRGRRGPVEGKVAAREVLLLCACARMGQRSRERLLRLFQGPIDWDHLLSLCAFHGTTPLLYSNLVSNGFAPLVPTQYWDVLKREYYQTLFRNTVLSGETQDVLSFLGRRRIQAIPLKGTELAEALYGSIAVRPTSDIDILVRSEDVEKARACLTEARYRLLMPDKSDSDGHAFHGTPFFKKASFPLFLELHWGLGDSRVVSFDEKLLWERALQDSRQRSSVLSLSPEDSLMFLAYHLTKHDTHLLKYLCDITELLKSHSGTLDWDYIRSRACLWGVDTALYYSMELARELLDAPVQDAALKALKPGFLRRWLLARLMPLEAFVVPTPVDKLRRETIAVVHSLMMRNPRQMIRALSLQRRGTRGGLARTLAWAFVTLLVAIAAHPSVGARRARVKASR